MGNYDVRKAEITVMDMIKYDAIKDKDGVIYKDMGKYLQMLVPMKNEKDHDTYEIYYNEAGKIIRVYGHPGNSGFTGNKYF